MDQNQIDSIESSVKSPPNFDTIPEDVALTIVKSIQSWAQEEGNEEQRKKGRKARDSTLRAAALTSSRTFEIYFTSMIQHVTLNMLQTFSFCQVLERGEPHYGALVRSICFEESSDHLDEANLTLLLALGGSFSTLPTTAESSGRAWQGMELVIGRCYRQLSNLQSLVLSSPFVSSHHFHRKIDQHFEPYPFLTSSLKRLFIQLWERKPSSVRPNLNARNATWLLVFCRQIEMASLGFEMSVEDFKHLSEFAETIAGVSSVEKLAINVEFVYKKEEKKTWWGTQKEENANHMGGSRKTESIINLLQTTSQLDALEIYVPALEVRDGDDSRVSLKCLSALGESFNSLKHLRLMGVGFGLEIGPSWLHYSFKALRVLTLDYKSLYTFPEAGLPESLEVLCLPFYSLSSTTSSEALATDFGEDRLIHNIIARGFQPSLTSLKEIVVPSRPIAGGGEEVIVPKRVKSWALGRSALAKAKEFESGKVKLRTVGRGEVAGDALKGEVFWSTLRWLSPP